MVHMDTYSQSQPSVARDLLKSTLSTSAMSAVPPANVNINLTQITRRCEMDGITV